MVFDLPTRRKVIKCVWQGMSMREIGRQPFGPSKTAVSEWIRHFLLTGSFETPSQGHRVRMGLMKPEHVLFLLEHFENVDPTIYLDEMQGLLIRFFARKYKISLICATLIRRGVNRKKLSLIAERRNEHERAVHMRLIRQRFTAEHIVCFDEARIDPITQYRTHGRGQERRVNYTQHYLRGQRGHSVLGFLVLEGMLSVAISPARGITSDMFLLDFKTHLLPHLNPFPGPRSVVLCDNAVIHHIAELRLLVEAAGALLLYLPAYGYDFQPVEKCFSKIRLWLSRNRALARSNPRVAIYRACMSITGTDAANYFRSCGIEVQEIVDGVFI